MKMDIGSSQSWWWESHNRPKHSKWLQENLGDVESNVQAMLTLIEGDADSFAQRAEMYYKKRPDLLKVVEQFYRGYRALAERYDQLTGSVRQIPSSIQSQYGIVSESPRGSPFGKQMAFKKQASSGLEKFKESSVNSYTDSNEFSEGDGDRFEVSSVDEKSVAESQERDDSASSSSSSCSDGEADHSGLEIQKLQQTVERLQVENKRLTEKSREKQQQYRDTEKRLHQFREDYLRAQKENNTLKAGHGSLSAEVQELKTERDSLQSSLQELEVKVSGLQRENEELAAEIMSLQQQKVDSEEEKKSMMTDIEAGEEKMRDFSAAVRVMRGSAICMLRKNNALVDQVSSLLRDGETREKALADQKAEVSRLVDEAGKLKSSLQSSEGNVAGLNEKVVELEHQVSELELKHLQAILECAEEKREAIRQLCFSMDLLNKKNQWLEELVLSAKSKLNIYQEKLAAAQKSWRLFS